MTPADLLGLVVVAALIFYALLGGADFGGGIWDLLLRGPRTKDARALIEEAIGPIWEANHVWLILVVVLMFTGFPPAFAAVSIGLFVPLVVLLFGIVLRGAAFTFRTYDRPDDAVHARWTFIFSASSVLAPLALGVVVGALASGRLGGPQGTIPDPFAWFGPFPLAVGLFAAVLFAYLAATYLAVEAKGELRDDFRRRAIAAGVAVFFVALLAAVLSWREAPVVFEGLTRRGWSLPLHVATGLAAILAFWALYTGRVRLARAAAATQVALIVAGWAASQYPWIIVGGLTLHEASAPRHVQVMVLWALAVGAVLLFPALYLLFRVFKGERPLGIVDRERP